MNGVVAQSRVSQQTRKDLGSSWCEETELQVHFRDMNERSWLFGELGQCLQIHMTFSVGTRWSIHDPSSLPLICFFMVVDESPRREKTQKKHILPKLILDLFVQWCKYRFSSLNGHSIQNIDSFTQLFLFVDIVLNFLGIAIGVPRSLFSFSSVKNHQVKIIHCFWQFILSRLRENTDI